MSCVILETTVTLFIQEERVVHNWENCVQIELDAEIFNFIIFFQKKKLRISAFL